MDCLKVLHTADWHVRDKNFTECKKCLEFLVETALEQRPDIVVVAGDSSDSQFLQAGSESYRLIVNTIDSLSEIAPTIICTGTPSHDGNIPLSLTPDGRLDAITLAPRTVHLLRLSCTVSAVPQPTKQYSIATSKGVVETDKSLADQMNAVFAGIGLAAAGYKYHVLAGHFSVSGSILPTGQTLTGRDIEISRDQISLAKADLVCLGHIHKSQKLEPNIFYCGSLYRVDSAEQEPKGFYIHEIREDKSITSHFFETPCSNIITLTSDFTSSNDGGWITPGDCLRMRCVVSGATVKYNIKCWRDEAEKLEGEIEQTKQSYLLYGARAVDIQIVRLPRETVRSTAVTSASSLCEKLNAMASLRGEAVPAGVLDKAAALEEEVEVCDH